MNEKRTKSIHRIDLQLPIVENDPMNIFCTIPSTHHQFFRTKTQLDVKTKPMGRIRSPARLKHLMGSSQVNIVFDTPSTTTLHSTSRKSRIQSSKEPQKTTTTTTMKDEIDRSSQASSIDRLLYESIGSFDDQHSFKLRNAPWKTTVHRSQLTSTKVLHARRSTFDSNGKNLGDHVSFDNRSQESITSTNERLFEQIEHLTHTYFPVIKQLRHQRPMPELPSIHRMYLHREETNKFMPNLSRTRVVK